MAKIWKKAIVALLALVCSFTLFAACATEIANDSIPLTDLAESYEGEVKDSSGNLLVPFDVAYPEAFESGRYKYDEDTLLLKLKEGEGTLSRALKNCGFSSLEKFSSSDAGNWYRAQLKKSANIHTAIQKARSLDEVLVADYDYLYETESAVPSSADGSADADGILDELIDDVLGNVEVKNQWYLTSSAIQRSWRYLQANGISAGGLGSVVVAVIDTGVDYTHPDLQANMWVNTAEIPGNGIDDDNNGYVDDIYGANTVADNGGADGAEGDPMDDHGHGTHVAGVIGAANNREGIVGVAYNAKIMAVKAGQSTGVFNQSDIAEAILYAYEMGADVINMSFGGSAISLAVQEALETAYTRSTLVASAGNDGMPNEVTDYYEVPLPNYPAALSYVVGVMSVGAMGVESSFTNWDVSAYNSREYEVYAPGEGIISTLPGGGYGMLSGTSMAAPVVSGAAALLRSYFTDRDMYPSRYIAAQLSATSGDTATCVNPLKHTVGGMLHNLPMRLNVYDALTKVPTPDVALYDWYMFDSESLAGGNNGDGVADAGETIDISPVLRNRWGMSEDTIITIDAESGLGGSNPYVELLTSSVNYGSVGTYSTKDELIYNESGVVTGAENTLKIKIADNCPNDYLIQLNVTITCGNALDSGDRNTYTTYGTIQFWVRNGVVLTRQITEDETWTKDNYYIIPSSLYIAEGATVTVEPGTQIQFWSNDPDDPYADTAIAKLTVAGKFIVNGSEEEPVDIFPSEMRGEYVVEIESDIGGYVELNYSNVVNPCLAVENVDHCYMTQNYEDLMKSRVLSSGQVVDSNRSAQICYAEVKSTIFYSITGGKFDDFVMEYSHFDNCIFTKCSFETNNANSVDTTFNNCVLQSQFSHDTTVIFRQRATMYTSWVNDWKFSEDGKTLYVAIGQHPDSGYPSFSQARAIAHELGGDIACIETEQELNWLNDNGFLGQARAYGLKFGEDKWVNGEPVGEFILTDDIPVASKNAYLLWDNGGQLKFDRADYWVLEIPTEDAIALDAGEIQKYIDDLYSNTGISYRFTGNAILNNFYDVDMTDWFRIQSAGRKQDSDYEQVINISGNWWGTTDEELIEKQIVDFDDYTDLADIYAGDYLLTPPEDTFPFVTDAYLLNSDGERVRTVGNETVTFVVKFNRDMDTTQSLRVRFGAAEPYAEYEVEGEFINARRWEGTYTLKTTIENGNQVINIENGRAADDHWLILCESAGRFQFEIDTTAAQAMIMQANPTETGIQLTWQQDDFETLAGYNVYRSESEDGFYQRLNDYVIPVGTTEFFDDTVEPGKQYFYNFTVVQTDMTESTPSGKISTWSLDTMAPDIYHSPVRTAYTGSNLVVSATITDNLRITQAKVWYRTVGGEWMSANMTALNSRYSAIIPAEYISLEGLEYYIEAFDGLNYTYEGSAENPFSVTVKQAVDKNALGDVDGDGTITTRDALMLLQAANDLLNLTDEQFLRADINGDKVLSAAEALRILQYVSGKVTTITA